MLVDIVVTLRMHHWEEVTVMKPQLLPGLLSRHVISLTHSQEASGLWVSLQSQHYALRNFCFQGVDYVNLFSLYK